MELSRLTPFEYVKNLLAEGIKPAAVVIGDDHRFGRNREGDFNALREMGKMFDFEVIALDAEYVQDIRVSSTKVRSAIEKGEVAHATELLTRMFPLKGEVVEGQKLGSELGYPTANLKIEEDLKIVPGAGAYAVWATTEGGERKMAMLNIGERPTVSDSGSNTIEVNLLDFSGDLYGTSLEVEFVERIRDERKFSSLEELKLALKSDEEKTRELLSA